MNLLSSISKLLRESIRLLREKPGLGILLLAACTFVGCEPNQKIRPAVNSSTAIPDSINAQGQIMPAAGFVQLRAAPGDVVDQLLIEVGDSVEEGQPLLELRSARLRQAQRDTLIKQIEEAKRQKELAVKTAEQQLHAIKLRSEQLVKKKEALARKEKLLELGREQVEAAKKVLAKLEAIEADSNTTEFVGQLEIDRQRMAVRDAKLKFETQKEAHTSAKEELTMAEQLAEEELQAAEQALVAAKASEAVEVLVLQLQALEVQDEASTLRAPQAGTIVALDANPGEAGSMMPLVEMANLDRIVVEVEVNEMDAALVVPGQKANIRSRAFDVPWHGKVLKKYQLVGRPQLRPLDPLARVDYRAVTVIVELDEAFAEAAKEWLQLQVDVGIELSEPTPIPAAE